MRREVTRTFEIDICDVCLTEADSGTIYKSCEHFICNKHPYREGGCPVCQKRERLQVSDRASLILAIHSALGGDGWSALGEGTYPHDELHDNYEELNDVADLFYSLLAQQKENKNGKAN